jgi:hypothetical protein
MALQLTEDSVLADSSLLIVSKSAYVNTLAINAGQRF